MRLTLAERFILLRHRMNLTQPELGKILGVSERTIKNVEAGKVIQQRTVRLFQILEGRYRAKVKLRASAGKVEVPIP